MTRGGVGTNGKSAWQGKPVCEIEAGQPAWYLAPECSRCGYIGKLRIAHAKLPPDMNANILRRRGWRIGQKLVCPKCVLAEHAPKATPSLEPETPDVAQTHSEIEIHAEPPRPPNAEERRRVRDALLDAYDEDNSRYRGEGSDKALAARLGVGWAWVEDLREAMGLGPDVNDRKAIADAEMAAINQELAAISADFLTRIGALETRVRRVEVERTGRGL